MDAVRSGRSVALGVSLGLAALALLSACGVAPADSGIIGTVSIGPTQPVSTPGTPDTKPYATELAIAPEGGLHLKRPVRIESAADGTFKVGLEPGVYVIQSASKQSPPTLAPLKVEVRPQRFTAVEVAFDSGIR